MLHDDLSGRHDFLGLSVVDHRRGQQVQTVVHVVFVVPGHELVEMGDGRFLGLEKRWHGPVVLGRSELGFRVGVVIGGPRSGETLVHPQEHQKLLGRPGGHRSPPVGMDRQFLSCLEVLVHGLADEPLGEPRVFPLRDHPAHDVTREEVQHDVEEVPLALVGTG